MVVAVVAVACVTPPRPLPTPPSTTVPASALLGPAIDWAALLADADPTWDRAPRDWGEALFTGNGLLGTTLMEAEPGVWAIELGDNAAASGGFSGPAAFAPRVPIGRLVLRAVGRPRAFGGRIDLWDAEAVGTITTDVGTLRFRHLTHATERTVLIELETTGAEAGATVTFEPAEAVSSTFAANGLEVPPISRPPEPVLDDVVTAVGTVHRVHQVLPFGQAEHGTAWSDLDLGSGRRLVVAAFEPRRPASGASVAAETAAGRVVAAIERGPDALVAEHRAWWHRTWPAGWVSVPDRRVQSFWAIQIYKHLSATRPGGVVLDNQGPWLASSGWPGTWWNLNVQLSYSLVATANRPDQLRSLCDSLWTYRDQLAANVGPFLPRRFEPMYTIGRTTSWDLFSVASIQPWVTWELGNLVWALAKCWEGARVQGDDEALRQRLVPLLTGAINTYLSAMVVRPDGTAWFPTTYSPEYPRDTGVPLSGQANANYALQTFAWGLDALLWADERFETGSPLAPVWRDARARVHFPQGTDGLWIAEGLPLAVEHRHFSHLLALEELPLLDPTVPAERDLIERSLEHWVDLGNRGSDFLGYARMYASRVRAALGQGDAALDELERALDFFTPNTFYNEPWPTAVNPVVETPLATAEALHRTLLQSRPDRIRVFVGTPSSWPDVAFGDLAAQGGFDVSAVRRDGRTQLVRVHSRAGEPLRIESDLADGYRLRSTGGPVRVERESATVLRVELAAGQEVVLWHGGGEPTAGPVEATGSGWGLPAP